MTARSRKVFISDIHMANARGRQGTPVGRDEKAAPFRYTWFDDNAEHLAHFLETQRQADDLSELVILGDLFDTWVLPIDETPEDYDLICRNKRYANVITALKALAGDSKVALTYVAGNHDMTVKESFVRQMFPSIRYLGGAVEDRDAGGIYRSAGIVAEHGHRFSLFNAVDRSAHQNGYLPIGYFITRALADKKRQTGRDSEYADIVWHFLKDWVEVQRWPESLVERVFLAIVEDADLDPKDRVLVRGVRRGEDWVSFEQISREYREILSAWDDADEPVSPYLATMVEVESGFYESIAYDLYLNRESSTDNVVVFGHTHESALKQFDKSVYANCGTWKDGSNCTYVEIEDHGVEKTRHVRVRSFFSSDVQFEASLPLPDPSV